MQHDDVLKKSFLPSDPILRVGGRGVGVSGQNICYHVAAFLFLFHLICNMTMLWKGLLLIPTAGWGGGGGICRQNICYHIAAFVILYYLICNMTMFWKGWILTYWPPTQVGGGGGGGRGVCRQKLLHFVIPFYLISNRTMFWKSWSFDPIARVGRGERGGSAGKIFATMLLHPWFSLIWYATRPCSEKVLTILPRRQGEGHGEGWESKGKLFATMLLHFVIPCSEKVEFRPFDPNPLVHPGGWDTGWGKILITVMLIYRYLVIMAYSEKLSDIIVSDNCEVYSTNKPI